MKRPLLIIFFFLSVACSSKPCNNTPQRPEEPVKAPNYSSKQTPKAEAPVTSTEPKGPTTLIYKETGELQCNQAPGQTLEEMQGSLTRNKIQVLDGRTQSDGKMRMALCGAPTGKIHVYNVLQKDLKKAVKLGFKEFLEKKKHVR